MPQQNIPSQVLNEILLYLPETGKFFWKVGRLDFFTEGKHTAQHRCNHWNSKFAGKEAFLIAHSGGYLATSIFGFPYLAHRIAFKMMIGRDPVGIDHINGIRTDNRWSNLREADQMLNAQNYKMPSNNTSGVSGVHFDKSRNRWRAYITYEKKRIELGRYKSFEQAVRARTEALKQYGFSERHGSA